MSNHVLHLSDHIADPNNGHGNMKKKKVGIAVGVIIFGLTTCVSIMIIKNPGKYCHGCKLPFVIGTYKRENKRCASIMCYRFLVLIHCCLLTNQG